MKSPGGARYRLAADVHVIAAGTPFQKLAVNRLEEPVMATPALSDGILYFRTLQSLVAVG